MSMMPHYDFVVLGSGIAGLAAAHTLTAAGKTVLVLDKGRRIGGRVSTKRVTTKDGHSFVFNHGAQFLTARDPGFAAICDNAQSQNSLANWHLDDRSALIGTPFMRAFPMFLGRDLEIRQDCEITAIHRTDNGFTFASDDGVIASATGAIITAPAPQTANLISDIAPELIASAKAAHYAPCWTALFGFATPPVGADVTDPSGTIRDSGIIGWAGWENARPGNEAALYGLTIQASAEWSAAHIEQEKPENIAALKSAYEQASGITLPAPSYSAAHRWRYAKVITPTPAEMPRLSDCRNVAIAGDWLGGARIEHAYLSGKMAGASVL